MPATGERAPERILVAVRAIAPVAHRPPKSGETMLAMPWPNSSLLDRWREGYDVVYAVRTQRAGETFLKKFTAALFYRLFARLTHIRMPLDSGDFRLLDRKVVRALGAMREQHRFIRAMTCWTGFRQTAVPYERASRNAGASKYEAIHLFRLAMDGLASFSGEPLRWFVQAGFLFGEVAKGDGR